MSTIIMGKTTMTQSSSRSCKPALHLLFISVMFCCYKISVAQAVFPAPASLLQNAKHKEQKSGVSMQGGVLVIQTGVGTPTSINRLSFSANGDLLAAAKDYGRVVIFDVKARSFARAIDTKQGIVQSVAISPDHKLLAVAGDQENGRIVLWNIETGKRTTSFDVGAPVVKELRFLTMDRLFVEENGGPTYIIDLANGRRVFEAAYEFWPVLSADGSLLITSDYQGFVLRSTSDFNIISKLPKPSKNSFPLAFSQAHNLLIVEDPFSSDGFVALRLSDGTLLRHEGLVKSLAANPSAGYFGSIQESTGIVFGHSDGKLWAWNPTTGRYCSTKTLYSEAGALSPDGVTVASGIDNGFLSGKFEPTGVLVWNTADVLRDCGMSSQ